MSFSGLAKRTKETIVNKKGRYKRKKRFGKSIGNRAPAMYLSIIEWKLGYLGKGLHYVDTVSFKASQYDHVSN